MHVLMFTTCCLNSVYTVSTSANLAESSDVVWRLKCLKCCKLVANEQMDHVVLQTAQRTAIFLLLKCKMSFLDDVEARSRCSYDVTVWLLLDQLHRLLLLQNQETVELGSCLFLVVVPAQIQQADRLSACFGHHPL